MKTLEVLPGSYLPHVIHEACTLAATERQPVDFTFNSIRLVVQTGDTPEDIGAAYETGLDGLRRNELNI